jgi:hypothetical protein
MGRGIRGGEQQRRCFGNICGERNPSGKVEAKGKLEVVVCWMELDFFIERVESGEER